MQDAAAPSWCHSHSGSSRFLVVAPHGGSRASGPSRNQTGSVKVNDLHTADLAALLAERLDGALIANVSHDRNEIDLNRVSQVRRGAPWFLDLLERRLAEILAHFPTAEILFVHGWNVTQMRCDIGIGAHLRDTSQATSRAAELTVSPDYVADRLVVLRDHSAGAGIHVTFGERYPAKHPNNILQLFRRPAAGDAAPLRPALANWARNGRLQAVQLELGAPLRWPGLGRQSLLDVSAAVFGACRSNMPDEPQRRLRPPSRSVASDLAPPVGLQFYDPACGISVMCRSDRGPDGGAVHSRLLILRAPLAAALFTGEERTEATSVFGGPCFTLQTDGLRLQFDGPLLELADARLYVELEQALAASHLSHARVDLTFGRGNVPGCGRVKGIVECGTLSHRIDTVGFTGSSSPAGTAGPSRSQTSLTAAFGPELVLRARTGRDGSPEAFSCTSGGDAPLPATSLTVHWGVDRHTPDRFTLALEGHSPVTADPISRMVIRRPHGRTGASHITFGAATFSSRAFGDGVGFYEHAQPVPTPTTTATG